MTNNHPKLILIAFLLLGYVLCFSSCGPSIDGSSDATFKKSYQELKKGHSDKDTAKLNSAIKVLAFSILGQRMDAPASGRQLTINNELRKQLDGKRYSTIISMAEDSLKSAKKREIAFVQKQIADLQTESKQRKAPYEALKKQLGIIQGRFIKIEQHGGEPTAYFEFKNTSKYTLDHFTLTSIIRSVSKRNIVTSSTSFFGGVKTLNYNDTLTVTVSISDFSKGETPEVPWNSIVYPVTDLSHYNMVATAYAQEIEINGKDVDLNTAKWSDDDQADFEQKLHDLEAKLKEAQNLPENLDNI